MKWYSVAVIVIAMFPITREGRAEQPISYGFYHVGTYGNLGNSRIQDINDAGEAVGTMIFQGDDLMTSISWNNGQVLNLEIACDNGKDGLIDGSVNGISERGHYVGGGGSVDSCCAAVCRMENTTVFAVPVPCFDNGEPHAVNSSGTMAAGYCYWDTTYPTVHFLADGYSINIGLLPDLPPEDAANAEAFDVNNDGLVVGTVFDLGNGGKGRAFMWQDGVLTEIYDALGGDALVAHAVNNKGHIVGFAGDEQNNDVAYIIRDGIMESLGLGEADGVNDRDVAVGNINAIDGIHAALFDNGLVIDLDDFLPAEWGLSYAWAINNYGWVVGWGYGLDGEQKGFLLVPIYDKGDYDGDGDVDFQDYGKFQECFAAEPFQGPDGGLHVGCSVFDFDDDVDLDLTDYAAFQDALTGPTAPDMNPYGPG